ncbi:myomegalin-like [Pleurodeles waltl]|uniref:myomegalin-like n=1 Tax=Pleurodeles waltl TaxID=8319 RepID=UPI0037094481
MSNGYRTLSQHLNDLKKENFSLKLRIYFLEERVKQKYEDSSSEDIFKRNIELKVEVESLKRELRDKQQFHEKSWAEANDLRRHNDAELGCHYGTRQQQTEHSQEFLENKIQLFQEETKLAKNEVERMVALVEKEKKSCLELSRKLEEFTAEMTEARNVQKQYCVALAEKDKMLQQLSQVLDSKDAQIQQLSSEKQNQQDKRIKCLEDMVQELTASLQQKENELKIGIPTGVALNCNLSDIWPVTFLLCVSCRGSPV